MGYMSANIDADYCGLHTVKSSFVSVLPYQLDPLSALDVPLRI
jgi:hypothetical protein